MARTVSQVSAYLLRHIRSSDSADFLRRLNEVVERLWGMGNYRGMWETRTLTPYPDPNDEDQTYVRIGSREVLLGITSDTGEPLAIFDTAMQFNENGPGWVEETAGIVVDRGVVAFSGTEYHTYKVPSTIDSFIGYVKFAPADLTDNDDEVVPDNIGALKFGLLATMFEEKSDIDRADLYWARAQQILETELGVFKLANHSIPAVNPNGIGQCPTDALY